MWASYGESCATHKEACIFAGIETPGQRAGEAEWYAMLDEIEIPSRPVYTVVVRLRQPGP